MKINQISWENYRALEDGTIEADGRDVAISGTNGAGKSSIASVLPFVLFGAGADKVKHFDNGQIPTDDGLTHAAQITFDNGLTLRREYSWMSGGNRHAFYINGESVNAKEFAATIQTLTRGGGELVINPFAFGKLKADDQRKILTRMFDVREDNILNQFPAVKKMLGNYSADEFIARANSELKKLKENVATIPARIEENERTLIDGDVAAVEAALKSLLARRDKLQADSFSVGAEQVRREIAELDRERFNLERRVHSEEKRLNDLRVEYRKIAASKPGVCPTCGQAIPLETFNAQRAGKLTALNAEGKELAAQVDGYKRRLAELDGELKKLEARPQVDNREQIAALNRQIGELTRQFNSLQASEATRRRIEKLRADEFELNKKITRLEGDIKTAQKFVLEKTALIEDEINGKFRRVKFKLFNLKVTTGEAKPTCEATMDGVPYSALSKGERLVAALDIFRTLQNYFGTEMPLMIDDAEAYTPGKFTGLGNQKFFFRVDTGKLSIAYSDVKIAA